MKASTSSPYAAGQEPVFQVAPQWHEPPSFMPTLEAEFPDIPTEEIWRAYETVCLEMGSITAASQHNNSELESRVRHVLTHQHGGQDALKGINVPLS